uniref:metallopeptidase TldD-related protein n=1 Tax=Escherichia coli TaxID=562 RepID=UPI00207C086A
SRSLVYLFENGTLSHPVYVAALPGSCIVTMQQCSMVGHDLRLDYGVGFCGEEEPRLPVGVGLPTLKVDNLPVGGTA